MTNYRDSTKTIENYRGASLKYRVVTKKYEEVTARSLDELDGLIVIDVYEGYKKLGRFKLKDIKLKFS